MITILDSQSEQNYKLRIAQLEAKVSQFEDADAKRSSNKSFVELIKEHGLEEDCFDIIRAALVNPDIKISQKAKICETVLSRVAPQLKSVSHTMKEPIQLIIHTSGSQAREVLEEYRAQKHVE